MSRRAVELIVGFFALLGFVSVPIGERTGLEHLRAILSTSAASEAFRSLFETSRRLGDRVVESTFEGKTPDAPDSSEAKPRSSDGSSDHENRLAHPLRPPSNSARSPRETIASPNECAPYTSFTWPGP